MHSSTLTKSKSLSSSVQVAAWAFGGRAESACVCSLALQSHCPLCLAHLHAPLLDFCGQCLASFLNVRGLLCVWSELGPCAVGQCNQCSVITSLYLMLFFCGWE